MAVGDRRHRPIPALIGDTFNVVGRRFREIAVIAIVAAAVAVISVAAITSALDIVNEEILENPRFEELIDLTAQEQAESEDIEVAVEAWLESTEGDRLVNAGLLVAAGVLVSLLGWATTIAFSLVALDDVEGRFSTIGGSLRTGLARVPKALLLSIVYLAVFLVMLIALGIALFVLSFMHPYLGVAAFVVGIAVAFLYFMPLIQMHFVVAYVEPGFPSFPRWWRLLAGNLAATWGRSSLIILANIAVGLILWIGLLALPSPYGDFISNAIVGPIFGALSAIAYALMYADLSGRSRPSVGEWPELGG
ncbi:hypothetical protein [Candidatus Poriferisodalis sp.]|uniref:hypothetical protein n=1 Tax=Candidatus Poriferisodalis sp. TaxID=3101277 RepID=UPI003B01E2DC